MTHWPEAPRLRDALDEYASRALTAGARDRGREVIDAGGPPTVVVLASERLDTAQARLDKPRTRHAVLAVAASIVLLVAIGLSAPIARRVSGGDENAASSQEPSAQGAAPATQPPDTPDTAPPQQPRAPEVDCAETVDAPAARSLDDIEIGVTQPGGLRLKFFVVGEPSWPEVAASTRLHEVAPATVYASASSLSELTQPATGLLNATCDAGNYLVVLGAAGHMAGQLACERTTAPAFAGFAFVNAQPLPDDCPILRPTFLVLTPGADTDPAAWAARYGCRRPTATVDAAGNVITRYGACTTTLVVIETASTDPWSATIDGQSLAELVLELRNLPR